MTDSNELDAPVEGSAIRKLYDDAMRGWMSLVFRWWQRARLRIGSAIIGDGYHAVIMRLWLIRDRAHGCILRDGRVILGNCEPLAEALYEPLPGRWSLTVTQLEPATPDQRPSETDSAPQGERTR